MNKNSYTLQNNDLVKENILSKTDKLATLNIGIYENLMKAMPYKKYNLDTVPFQIYITEKFYLQDGNVFFPLFDVNFFEENKKVYLNSEPFLNCLFLVRHNDPKLARMVRIPDYMDVLKTHWNKNFMYMFIEADAADFANVYSYLYEFDFIFV